MIMWNSGYTYTIFMIKQMHIYSIKWERKFEKCSSQYPWVEGQNFCLKKKDWNDESIIKTINSIFHIFFYLTDCYIYRWKLQLL